MSPTDWDKEMAKIDRQLESISDEALLPSSGAKSPAEREAIVATQGKTRTLGVFARLLLAVVLGVAMIFWPYSARCGAGLFGYLTAIGVLITAGVWTAVWTWRHRTARGHIVSLAVLSWGLLLGATELLPRLGYAKPTPEHPAIWMCE
ncbi:MAG TPA: hypothetical protein VJ672_14975 [Gemmatimonadaceae bacterium]|nr:hypothetical protein [Gemmatimonadaceae bacterium]